MERPVRSKKYLETAFVLFVLFTLIDGAASAQVNRKSPGAPTGAVGTKPKPEGAAAKLSQIVASGRLEDLRWPNFSDYRSQIISFYRPSAYRPAWTRDGQPTPQSLQLIRILQDADSEGLRPEDYDASRWTGRVAVLGRAHGDDDEARFDAALTVCTMRYVSDLQIGRVNPQHLGFEFEVVKQKLDLPQFVRERLVDGSNLQIELSQLGPTFPGYKRLRDALRRYEELARRDTGEKLPPFIRAVPGQEYANLGRVSRLLRLLGDLPENIVIPPDANVYQGALVDAVKRFQESHGLDATGLIDKETVAEMNVPLSDRVEQMRLGLERYRWLPYDFKQPPIVINVPEFRLYGFDEKGQVGISMNVNVGDQYDFQTPMFEKNMLYVVFRPYWTPPPTILRHEIITDLKETPSLDDIDLELVTGSGQIIRSGLVTPAMLQQIRSGQITVRQPPGPDNALGLVKFIFPNEYHVYMHDTPESEQKFSKEKQKVFSHGCIHAEEPDKLAAWVLRNTPGWDLQRVQHAMREGRDNVQVNLASPIPVLIVYQTAIVKENGEIYFFHDIYGHDRALERELNKGYPHNN